MHVAFRVDASIQIGTGHVMRCLTLADALMARGDQCTFLCRPHAGHMLSLIALRGHKAVALQEPSNNFDAPSKPPHAAWLGANWSDDAEQTRAALAGQSVDWLVVDHYALDHDWECALRDLTSYIFAIDDLADRQHECDLLLDQNLGRSADAYKSLVTKETSVLVGPQYALLRPEFEQWRNFSLARRRESQLKHLFINMGGVDKDNATGEVLTTLVSTNLPPELQITVVMGAQAPWLDDVQLLAAQMPWPTQILIGVNNMAELMASSDLAIGAAGSTSWERCCLGLPTISVVLAENQTSGAKALADAEAVVVADRISLVPAILEEILKPNATCSLPTLVNHASKVTDGHGIARVLQHLHHHD